MVVIRRRNVKVFTFAFLLITVTSFLLNYTHQVTTNTWDPRHLIVQFSEQVQKLFKYPKRPCSCRTCTSELGRSLWFDQRFNSTMQPFLTSQNALIPEDSYRWWLKLQGEKTPKNINATLKEFFGIIPGDGDPLQERGTFTCRRCAVVGNSGNLRQSQYGQEIDSHDFVLRMNRAPTAGYESDVGSKTTHHFVYPESYKELAENVSMILIPFKTLDLHWVVSALTTGTINFTYVPVPRKIKVKKEKILVYNPAFMKYVYENWLEHHGRYPSTGLLSLVFALHVCDEVNVYGFGADSKGHWHHYWENNASAGAFRKTGVHDGDFEFNLTLTLASIEKISFFQGQMTLATGRSGGCNFQHAAGQRSVKIMWAPARFECVNLRWIRSISLLQCSLQGAWPRTGIHAARDFLSTDSWEHQSVVGINEPLLRLYSLIPE